jgi:hypothetical protein
VRFGYWASAVIERLRPLIGLKTLIFRGWQAKIRPLATHPPLKALVSGFIFLSDFSGFNPSALNMSLATTGLPPKLTPRP